MAAILQASAGEFLDTLERLDKEERYSDLVKYFEANTEPARVLSARESYLVMDGYFGVNDYAKTMEYGEMAVAKDPKNELAARVYMFAARKADRTDDSLKLGLGWIEHCPEGRAIYKDVAISFSDKKDYASALKYAQIASERAPEDQRAKGIFVYALAQVQGVEAAVIFYDELRAKIPKPETYFMVQYAKGLYDQDAFARLVPILELILKETPSEVDASRMYMHTLNRLDRAKEAYAHGSAWIAQFKPDAEWCNGFGAILYDRKEYKQAQDYFEKAVYWDGWYATAVENLIVTLNEQDEYGAAIQFAAKWQADHPSAWTAKMDDQIGNSYAWLKLFDLAEIYYRRAQQKSPQRSDYVRDLVYVIRKQNRPVEALAFGRHWLEAEGKGAEETEELLAELKKAEEMLTPAKPEPSAEPKAATTTD